MQDKDLNLMNIILIVLLIILTAFFVAAEFAIVKVRSTRIDQLVAEGSKSGISAKKIIDNLDGYLSACQLGITVTALGLGWLGEPTVKAFITPLIDKLSINDTIASVLSFLIAFFIITFLNVVVGELAPKSIAIQKAENVTLLLAKPLILFYKVMFPLIWLLNSSSRMILHLFGFKAAEDAEMALSEEELRLILADSYKGGQINKSEMDYVNNIFEFDERVAREIMVPRTEMVCFYKNKSMKENVSFMDEGQYTRYPVAEEDKDHILGLVNMKELFTRHMHGEQGSIVPLIRPIIHVSEATPIKQVLLEMQKKRIHMAIVIDEYGGTAGLLTVEDILEEIVGEIRDEFDYNEKPMIEKVNDTTIVVDGKLLLNEVNELIGTSLIDDEIDTIGGWVITHNMEAKQGTVLKHEGYQFIVAEIDGYQIKKVKIIKEQ